MLDDFKNIFILVLFLYQVKWCNIYVSKIFTQSHLKWFLWNKNEIKVVNCDKENDQNANKIWL